MTWVVSSSLYPNRICTKCRISLTRNPLAIQAPINLNKPTRQHSLATIWIPGDCSLCDNMYTQGPGRPKKKRKGLSNPKENVSEGSFVLICKYCGIESSQRELNFHNCSMKDSKENIIDFIEQSKVSSLAVASRIIRNACKPGDSLMIPTGGRPTELRIGIQAKPMVSFSAEDILKQTSEMQWSSRQSSKNVITIRQNLLNQNIKAKFAGKNTVRKLIKERTEDLITESIVKGNKGSQLKPVINNIKVI